MRPVWDVLVWIVLPLWAACGFLDYLCHLTSHIERAAGLKETLFHWLMLVQAMAGIGLALFLRVDAMVFLILIALLVAHEITAYFDLRLALPTRRVSIFEHQVHSALEIVPLCALLLLMILHWPQALALFGMGAERADFSLGLKQPPRLVEILPPLAVFMPLAILPYLEEVVRDWRQGVRRWRGL